MRALRVACLTALFAATCMSAAGSAQAASKDPIFTYTPAPEPGSLPPFIPPPVGVLEGPCGLTVDSLGRFYVSDYHHDAVDRLSSNFVFADQIAEANPSDGPCGLAAAPGGPFYLNGYHGGVTRFASFPGGAATTIDSGPATGVAVATATGETYVDDRDRVAVYQASGVPVEVGGEPLEIGEGSLEAGYGIAVSGYAATEGLLYVPDATANAVKVYDPAADTDEPVAVIDGSETPLGAFSSLADSAIAVDDASGRIYVADDLQPESFDRPEAAIYVFNHSGAYEGRLKYNIIDARPPGLAVDNSGGGTQSRVYVTSGNTEKASVIAYAPGSAGSEARPAPEGAEPLPPGGCACSVVPEPPVPVTCEGDSCQHLPSEPTDPTLNTQIEGAGNRPVRFHDTNRLGHYLRLRHHHRSRRGARRSGKRPQRVYRGKTSQKKKIQLSTAAGQITLIRFKVKMLCRDGSLLNGDLSDFDASPLKRGGRFSDVQRGPTDSISWHGRLRGRSVSGSLRVRDRLKSGVRCDSGLVGFSAKRAG